MGVSSRRVILNEEGTRRDRKVTWYLHVAASILGCHSSGAVLIDRAQSSSPSYHPRMGGRSNEGEFHNLRPTGSMNSLCNCYVV